MNIITLRLPALLLTALVIIITTSIVFSPEAKSELDLERFGYEHSLAELVESQYVLDDFSATECSATSPMVIAIKSSTEHFELRAALRQLWLKDAAELDIRHFFILGDPQNETTMSLMIEESNRFHDLVVGKFVDHYYNLTIKNLFTLNWIKINCPRKWLFVSDDDSMVKIRDFLDIVVVEQYHGSNRTVFGYGLGKDPPVNRKPMSKWFIPRSVYTSDRYPTYATGRGVLIPPQAIIDLHSMAFDESARPRLKIDDVYVYGVVRELANVSLDCSVRSTSLAYCPNVSNSKELLKCLNHHTILADSGQLMIELAKPQRSRLRRRISSSSRSSVFERIKCP